MYAIIEEGGGQRQVAQGDEVLIDLIEEGQAAVGKTVSFDKVLVVGNAGGSAKIGQPYVKGATVSAEVVEPVVKGDKIVIWRFREKKAWQRQGGHRQRYTKVKITAIAG